MTSYTRFSTDDPRVWRYDLRCCVCGQFCTPADRAVHFGRAYDPEPPDPVYWCARCARRETQEVVARPHGAVRRIYWIKPNWLRVANSILRHQRRHAKAVQP